MPSLVRLLYRVVAEAADLVGGIVGQGDRARAIDPHAGAVARQVVAVGVGEAADLVSRVVALR